MIEIPVEINPFPHEELYQYQAAFEPNEPPISDIVVELPWHKVVETPEIPEGSTENIFTTVVTLEHVVVLQ